MLRWICLVLCAGWSLAASPSIAGSDHWSLMPVERPEPPPVERTGWADNPIDRFVLAKLEDNGLRPSDEAPRRLLIRRLRFGLTGLPPTSAEVEQFIGDERPDAYERLVDRLLASPHYGQRWARHWLDVARYTESHGFERDWARYSAWPYRDYVIEAFNDDKPYDQFVRQQIAGDVMEPVTAEGMIAASFLVAGPWNQTAADQQSEIGRAHTRQAKLEELVATVSQGFMGLTVDCARCHDHLNDPISQEDYYRIRAVFDGVWHGERPVGTAEQLNQYEQVRPELESKIEGLEKKLATLEDADSLDENQRHEQQRLRKRLAETKAQLEQLPSLLVAYVGRRQQPEPARLKQRGDATSPAGTVAPGGLSAIAQPSPDLGLPADAPEAERRLRFADWVTHPQHPLTARVMVNRVWHYHFGTGIVDTPNDFGALGGEPSHPELLDYLAGWFVENDWSVKALHRLIVTSATYRQASRHRSDAAAIDADNRLLWRFAPRRLEAEAIRDAQLAWSGLINYAMGGESFQPFEVYRRSGDYYLLEDRAEPAYHRRTVYRMNVVSGKDPLLDAFDCPDPGSRTPARRSTVTPLQALGMMNNPFVQRQVRHFADRVLAEAGDDQAQAIDLAYQYVFGRPVTRSEREQALELVREHGMAKLAWVLFNSSEAIYVR